MCEVFFSPISFRGNSFFSSSKHDLKCARRFFSSVLCNSRWRVLATESRSDPHLTLEPLYFTLPMVLLNAPWFAPLLPLPLLLPWFDLVPPKLLLLEWFECGGEGYCTRTVEPPGGESRTCCCFREWPELDFRRPLPLFPPG